ncbi:trypsin-like peptidase domain-containing protein [Winogradskyella ouciana]|uniref:Serine protease n=1 Tax=Winogradskyella ouciana TaxID=2608631 RepID=A0A7K1GGS9_9FLAO|nr:trypsin-like peptidase domain-containing protein [Winogradskyella ouciana]MTE28255.1 trypsin-like serine protease [Winogradskyella ouciana]
MKNIFPTLFIVICFLSLNAQEKIIEYPFGKPGSDVPRGVFGEDDRKEIKDAEGFKDFARATAVMISKQSIYNDEFYSWSLRDLLAMKFGTNKFDPSVKFLDQPTVGSCTGFLIAPDILVTAGHCINSMEEADQFVWVFDYTSESDFIDGNKLKFKKENIFEVESIITSKLDDITDDDYAILKLDRKSSRNPYRFRTSGKVLEEGAINTIGCPTGLPLKFSTNAIVVDNSPNNWFKSDIDSFPGNSGGPVFDQNGFIEGILVRGAVEYSGGRYTGDYKYDPYCDCVKTVQWDKVKYTAGCQAHKITAVPPSALLMAIYSNIEYAIVNNLKERFDSWGIYCWIFDYKYTQQRGRFENLAIEYNNNYALESILNYTSENISDSYARELIDLVLKNNNLDALDVLLDYDILADAGMDSKYTALQVAVTRGNLDIAQTLMVNGADISVTTSNNDNLLHLVAQSGNLSLAKILVEKGVSAKAKNKKKRRPEKVARKAGHKSLAKYLKKARKGRL